MALLHKYRVDIIDGGSPVTMTPANDRLVTGWVKDGNRRFFRKTLKTALRFIKDDFQFWKTAIDLNICNNYQVEIYRNLGAGFVLWYTGRIYLNNVKPDYTRGICEMTVEPEDVFTCFNNKLKQKINWLDFGAPVNCFNVVGSFESVVCTNVVGIAAPADARIYTPVDCVPGGAAASQYTVSNQAQYIISGGTEMSIKTEWMREVYFGPTAPDDSFVLISAGKWARPASLMPGELKYDPTIDEYILNQDPNNLQRFFYFSFLLDYDTNVGLDNGRLVREALPLVITSLGCELNTVSDFFNINPAGDAPTNGAYTRAAERLADLLYFQRSDVAFWYKDANAQKLEMTVEEFLNNLTGPLNCDWTIETIEGVDTLRIEHVSYFEGANQNDFTADPYLKYIRGRGQFEVSAKNDIPKYDEFSLGQSRTDYFLPAQIFYEDCSSTPDARPNAWTTVSNDLAYLSSQSSDIGTDGMSFVAIYEFEGKNYTWNDYARVNGALSWRDILVNYWRYERPSSDITIISGNHSEGLTALSRKKLKRQTSIQIPVSDAIADAFNPSQLQKSTLGWGEVEDAEFETLSNVLTINLTHQ